MLDLRHVREHAELHAANCERRNYRALAGHPGRIVELFGAWQARQREGRALREEANAVRRQLANAPVGREVAAADGYEPREADSALQRARALKQQLAGLEAEEAALQAEMQQLGQALPNLTSAETPDGEPAVLCCINGASEEAIVADHTNDRWRSHVHIGAELGILDFAAAGAASGWGWYYLLGDGARLEQALVQFALTTAHRHGWRLVSPPSLVRSSVAAACGFQPRDQGGEQQTYVVGEADSDNSLSLTATAEIPLAALYADTTLPASLPLRRAAVSRCYRAEAGARGARTKGLYRVHEFTKVELFAWTAPDLAAATETFDELVDLQTEILSSLGLPARVLEMPATDLGASAFRKIDMEVFFPSRSSVDTSAESGWGEVSSASICTDYQTRRLATRARVDGAANGNLTFPWTLNGTALAVPRILAALLEHGWDEDKASVLIPECLRPWMDGQEYITKN